jgi:hypothetical protein
MKTTGIFLVFLNFITAILSLVVIGGGAYILSTFSEWTSLFGSGSVWIAIAGGVVAFLKENRCYLSIYGLVILAVLAATGAGLYFYNDGVGNLDDATSKPLVTSSIQIEFNDRLLSTYTYCCAGCASPTCDPVIPVGECDNCDEVEYCTDALTNDGACYSAVEGEPKKPANSISESVCTALEKLKVNGAPIVGNNTLNAGSCGGGKPRQFTRAVYDWIDSNTTLIYSGSIGFAVLMAITLIATVYVACCGSDTD